ncbi:glycosyltransferase [Providencia rettgeri]|nr:glycosyltransferase [Providencia rettgeri]
MYKKYINEPKIKIIKNNSNVGGGIARNIGINNSSGEYIAFMDHDDKWYSSKIENS